MRWCGYPICQDVDRTSQGQMRFTKSAEEPRNGQFGTGTGMLTDGYFAAGVMSVGIGLTTAQRKTIFGLVC
jgi:hypothetical protein